MEALVENKYTYKDFESNQEVRWCPGCDDYVILRSMQKALPEMAVKKETTVVTVKFQWVLRNCSE